MAQAEPDPSSAQEPDRRAALCFALGAAAALLVRRAARPTLAAGGSVVSFWVADRDGGALYGLDAALCFRARHELEGPMRVAVARGGVPWVACEAPRAGELRLLCCDGAEPRALHVGRGRALGSCALGDGVLLVAEGAAGAARWCAWSPAGEARPLRGPASCRALVADGRGGALHAADAEGALWRLEGSAFERVAHLGEPVADLASAGGGGLWALCGARVLRLGADLEPRAALELEAPATLLAQGAPGRGTWAVGERLGAQRVRPDGRAGARVRELSAPGVAAALVDADAGLLLLTAGALLAFDARGRPRPGQGGFARATDLAAVAPDDPER